ncbi:phosphopantetheine-binding protein [Paenibacillus gorillae]|uniref:phosphopantetheine-binding protein n=1 Tax=Paenibacillus gorillae TaxID=1243662 RepID=UPI0004BCB051|nr:phosphopantetheine-binding protein [Paenibacillus gorillae]
MSCGEAAVCILLKPLDAAIRDNDIIHAVIKSTAVNNNANRSSSPSAPDSISQSNVLSMAWEKAEVNPLDLGYIEAHGSGTKLGDSLEIEALNLAFLRYTEKKKICPISTIKSNTGHSYNAAGLVGLLKAILSLREKVVFPTIHFEKPNPMINFENSAVYVNTEFKEWTVDEGKTRYAGVTSLGASGTNCHVVLQEAISREQDDGTNFSKDRLSHLVTVSSMTELGLRKNLEQIYRKVSQTNDYSLRDISYTLNKGRKHHEKRYAFIARDVDTFISQINKSLKDDTDLGISSPKLGKLILLMSDHEKISKSLFEYLMTNHYHFSKYYEECIQLGKNKTESFINFAFQYSYYKMLESYGVTSIHILASGIGEIILNVISGIWTLEEAVKEAVTYKPVEIENLEQRIQALIERESGEEYIFFIEIGPISSLSRIIENIQTENYNYGVFYLPEEINEYDPIDVLIKRLYMYGYSIEWGKYYEHYQGNRVVLPSYQFVKERCWIREEPWIYDESNQLDSEYIPKPSSKSYGFHKKENEIAYEIAECWSDILEVQTLTIEDNFFELGGDSLKSTKVITQLNNRFQIKLDFEDIFDYPSIIDLAAYIDSLLGTEKKVSLIFKEILKMDEIGPEDNFFDLGGHSLMANQVLLRIESLMQVVLNFEEIFNNPTPFKLAAYIDEKIERNLAGVVHHEIIQVEERPYYDVSASQKRLWLLSQIDEGSVAYNSPFSFILEGKLNVFAFEQAFELIIKRHESLRTVFYFSKW